MAEAKINVFQFLSKVAVKQIVLCSCVIKSLSMFGIKLPSSVWNNPEEYSFFFRFPFQDFCSWLF